MRGRTNAVSGTVLPELSNPAGAANIQSGYQAINGDGEVVTGTYVPPKALETVSGRVYSSSSGLTYNLAYTDGTTVHTVSGESGSKRITVAKNSIVCCDTAIIYVSGGARRLASPFRDNYLFEITDNFTLECSY